MRNKDNVELICDIAELAGLFEKSASLSDFLQTAVSTVAWHMKAAVCSIYLYDEDQEEVVLRATQGLNPEAIGQVRLKIGEGITGAALKELRPICEGHGSRNPHFKFIPGTEEEKYEAFLAVPILRGLERVGVMVVQDPEPNYFDDKDVRALRAIAAQLANTIVNADLLIGLHRLGEGDEPPVPEPEPETAPLRFLRGKSASKGLAAGEAVVLGRADTDLYLNAATFPDSLGLEAFDHALSLTERQINEIQNKLEEEQGDIASLIFSAHLLMLRDTGFSGEMRRRIEAGESAPGAIVAVVNEYVHLFSQREHMRLREKVQDVKDLGHRLLGNLSEDDEHYGDYAGAIIIAGELLPSDLVRYSAQNAEGIVLVGGGTTSHISILAQSLRVPVVISGEERLLDLVDGTELLLDGNQGTLFVDPEDEVRSRYREAIEAEKKLVAAPETIIEVPQTRDGTRVQILANINLLSDIDTALKFHAEGIGLYRSEFPFIIRNNYPSEEEQHQIYRKVVQKMDGRDVVFRTLDIGGDKMLSYFPSITEDNPFLGLRAIRFSLRHRDIFSQQLRAMIRAAAGHPVRIMFPLISSVDDFVEAREIVEECYRDMREAGEVDDPRPLLGVMIELPSAIEVADELAREADFLSIGSNDLIQYTLAVDRTNEQVSHMYLEYHPAVLRALKRIVDAGRAAGIDVSLCGAMAAEARLVPFLIGIGLRRLSVAPQLIPTVQQAVAATDLEQAENLAERLLKAGRIREVEDLLGIQ